MKKTICVLTATRAEYGLLKQVIQKLSHSNSIDVRIAVTGAHLSPEFGLTFTEIEKDGIIVDEKIEILLSADTPSSIAKSMGLAMIGFADYFNRLNPDLLVVLGDRYETLAVCCAAMIHKIPIAHLYGGETTLGAVDEAIRHAITKLSYLHFTSTEEYRKRVIQLGEHPDRVFWVGAIGVENIKKVKLLEKIELERALGMKLDKPYAVITYHPVTLENDNTAEQFQQLLNACSKISNMKFIFTKANADGNGRIINKMIDEHVSKSEDSISFASMGLVNYLSSLKYCAMVIGNSSSGIVEAPSFGIPTINIGARQKGRIQGVSIINCEPLEADINTAIGFASSDKFKIIARNALNPYELNDSSQNIVETIKKYLLNGKIDLRKEFFDSKTS